MSEVINKHSRMPKKGESKPVFSKRGLGNKHVPAEQKQQIVESAKDMILAGHTIDQIADKHGIAPRTLDYWLAGLGDEYEELRRAWLDGMLSEAGELLKAAENPVAIAKARELWKRATWYAERRDRQRYGQEVQQLHIHMGDLGDRLRRARERTINIVPDKGENKTIAVSDADYEEWRSSEPLRLAHARDPV